MNNIETQKGQQIQNQVTLAGDDKLRFEGDEEKDFV
jgi:hypothetical protein